MTLPTDFQTELESPAFCIFGALEIALDPDSSPPVVVRLLDGPSVLSFDVDGSPETFSGSDAIYGTLGGLSSLDEQADNQAQRVTVTLMPPDDAGAVDLISEGYQGAQVRIWVGVRDNITGLVIDDPELVFDGELDVGSLVRGADNRGVDLECYAVEERFFDTDTGARLSDAHHRSIWPDEKGLEFMVRLLNHFPGTVYGGGSGGGGVNGGLGSGPGHQPF